MFLVFIRNLSTFSISIFYIIHNKYPIYKEVIFKTFDRQQPVNDNPVPPNTGERLLIFRGWFNRHNHHYTQGTPCPRFQGNFGLALATVGLVNWANSSLYFKEYYS